MEEKIKDLTPLYGRLLVRLARPFPNFDFSFIKPVRQKAVELMELTAGDRVLDGGCGPGGSFPFLVNAVGASGKVIGIEISPQHAEIAKNRIAINRWENVEVLVSAAADAELTGVFNGLLMFAAPDVYASRTAMDNITPHLSETARIVVFGAKLSTSGLGRVLNPILKLLYKLSFSTTPRPTYDAGHVLADYVDELAIEEYFFGLMFLASGIVKTLKK
jgi:ubiquinone/menaquinone biosynthesis C-methylase UbiE